MIAFCVNASPQVGMGHLVRCRVFAEELAAQGIASLMYGPSLSYRIAGDEDRFAGWQERPAWTTPEADARAFVAFAAAHGVTKAVIDDYRADAAFQAVLKEGSLDWLQQFDASLEQRFLGRLVVNASPYERPEYYRAVSSHPDVRFLLGPRYAILRREFAAVVPRDPESMTGRVFLSFGGGDDKGAALGVLSAMRGVVPAGTGFVLVSGGANPRNAEIARHIAAEAWDDVDFLVNPPNIPALMSSSDVAVLGGGTTTYEAAHCGLPMLLVAIAENQVRQAVGWEDLEAAIYLGRWGEIEPETIAAAYLSLTCDPSRSAKMSRRGAELVDCDGTARLIAMLLKGTEA